MALFGKNPNEAAYKDGKKHWADVIKNTGPGELLIWRQPEEDFNTNSTLTVMSGEEALFIKGGNIEQTFDNGTYKLSTENYPFISRLRNAFTGGISTFNCVVYFVRKAHSMEILWGTSSPIQVYDKMLDMPASLRARGSYKIQVGSGEKLLTKLLGNNVNFLQQTELENYFSNEFQAKIKSCIARTLNESTQMLFGVDSRLDELSEAVTPHLAEILDDYGLMLKNFSISGLDLDEEIKQRYKQASLGRIDKQKEALGDKDRMAILGDDWGRQQAANILGTVAANPGAGGVAAAGAGIGMGMAAGGVFGNMAQQMFTPMQQQAPAQPAVPQPPASGNADDPVAALKKLKEMLDLGLIEQAEFDVKKTEIMGRM
jgi:membrane protease subunit (stomatin/prohibitin family)